MVHGVLWRCVLLASIILALGQGGAAAAGETAASLNGRSAVAVGTALTLPAWNAVAAEVRHDEGLLRDCLEHTVCKEPLVRDLANWLWALRDASAADKLAAVQHFVASVDYLADESEDLWSPPLAVLTGGAGDCEDVAIAKYVLLRLLNFEESRLRVLMVTDEVLGIAHAVVVVDLPSGLMVLDNRGGGPLASLPRHYVPLYAFNEVERWVFAPDA